MNQPTVCAVMLTADRPELARRAVECFRRQTYQRKYLAVWDSGVKASSIEAGDDELWIRETPSGEPIGTLRNSLVRVCGPADIIVHLDDDDWSHPNRIAEQVALLQSSGADCVGYREMLFSRRMVSRMMCDSFGGEGPDGRIEVDRYEAWLYSNPNPGYALGTSLCYWRETWERKPFAATSKGEDLQFITGLKCVGRSSIEGCAPGSIAEAEPRMIARIHGSNTSTAYDPRKMEAESRLANPLWRRVPEWDEHCRSVME